MSLKTTWTQLGSRYHPTRKAETILLAEDDQGVRNVAGRLLREAGYTVMDASDGIVAVSLSDATEGPIELLISDVVLPNRGGRDLAADLATSRPRMQILFMSGYSESSLIENGGLTAGCDFIQKPFSASELIRKVTSMFDTDTFKVA